MTSSWFFLYTLNYDARSTTHQRYAGLKLKCREAQGSVFVANVYVEHTYSWMAVCGEPLQKMYVQLSMAERNFAQRFGRGYRGTAVPSSHVLLGGSQQSHRGEET